MKHAGKMSIYLVKHVFSFMIIYFTIELYYIFLFDGWFWAGTKSPSNIINIKNNLARKWGRSNAQKKKLIFSYV